MEAVAASSDAGPKTPALIILGALSALSLSVATGTRVVDVALLVLVFSLLAASHRALLRWNALVSGIVLVIFFIPIKRYGLPVNLPFSLEPYRIVVMLVAAAWLTSVLIDRKVKLRSTGLEIPLALLAFSILMSEAVNGGRIHDLGVSTQVVKTLTFFASFIVILYVFVSVVRSRGQLDRLIKLLVVSGTVVATAAVVESRTGYNVFNHLGQAIPALQYRDPAVFAGLDADFLARGRLRVYASAAHPIELAAVLSMLVPLALYLARRDRRWFICGGLLTLGTLATVSRTGVLMLLVIGLTLLFLRPTNTLRLWPAVIPLLLVVHFALPQTLGSIRASFFPKGGLIAEQSETKVNSRSSDGRLADIGPSLREFSQRPLFGQGFGTRIVSATYGQPPAPGQSAEQAPAAGPAPNARLLDDAWLSLLLETGALGAFALLWLFTRSIKRLIRLARTDEGDDGWLATSFAASIAAFAIAMLTFDALGFVQVTILLFILLALSSVLLRLANPEEGITARTA
jgi:polysaccharide biosynthesis protein PslJ